MIADQDLCLAAQTGDTQAAYQLVRRHHDLAHHLAHQVFLPGSQHQDVEQEALIGLWIAAVTYRPGHGASYRTFATSVIRNRLGQAIKHANRGKHHPLNHALRTIATGTEQVDAIDTIIDRRQDPHRATVQREQLNLLIDATRALTPLERRAVIGIASGHSYSTVAAEAGTTAKAIDNAVTRARTKLRAVLEAAA